MPRHNIYPPSTTPGAAPAERLELHWQRDGGVQLASTTWAGEGPPDSGREYLPQTRDGVPTLAWEGRFIDLDRDKVNHLIKQLRIARDQAYGRDE